MNYRNTATIIATAAATFAAATPSFAAENVATAAAAVATASAGAERKGDADASKTKICVKLEANTGSRLSPRQCRTKAEWEALGLDTASAK